jgi:hypothetical protein
MVPATQNIKIMRGDTEVFVITLKDSANVPIVITGNTFISQIRYLRDSASIAASFTCVVTDGPNGVVTLTLTAGDSATLVAGPAFWDLQRTNASVVSTILSGKCTILADVSRA